MAGDRGHRVEPHTADVILHAWGPDFPACCEEAAMALLAICVDVSDADDAADPADASANAPAIRVRIGPGAVDSMLLDLLDELVFVLDTESTVPRRIRVDRDPGGGLVADLEMVDRAFVEVIGSAPKAVSRSELTVEEGVDGVRCSFLVDV